MAEDRNPTTHVAFVLDHSGSMASLKTVAINGFNTQKQTLITESRNPNSPNLTMTVCMFNNIVDFPFRLANPTSVQDINKNLYKPNGGTALYDGVMDTIKVLETGTDLNDDYNSYLVIIISDGAENSSNHTTRDDLAERIQTLQTTKRWTFTYIGSNQDLSKISQELNIPVGNMANFVATQQGTSDALKYTASKIGTFLSDYKKTRSAGAQHLNSSHSTCNFFGGSGIIDASKEMKKDSVS